MIPLTKWISPFKPNSPKIMILSGICKSFFIFFNKDTAIGKSKCEPFLFISTGSKFIMYFLGGNSIWNKLKTLLILSLDSFMILEGKPTKFIEGMPFVLTHSTLIKSKLL